MEVDEPLPPVAAISAAMAQGEAHAVDDANRGGFGESDGDPRGNGRARSESHTREYLSLPGSPHSENEPVPLPLVGMDWDDFEVIYNHMPLNQRERAKRVQEVGMFNHQVLKEYFQTHLMALFPGQSDLSFDYGAWWARGERHGFTVFNDSVVHGHHQSTWGTFVEQWFIQQDYWANRPNQISWTET